MGRVPPSKEKPGVGADDVPHLGSEAGRPLASLDIMPGTEQRPRDHVDQQAYDRGERMTRRGRRVNVPARYRTF